MISFKFGDVKLLDITNFLGGAISLDYFFKTYKTSETKKNFPYEWFDNADKLKNTKLTPYEAFYSKVCRCNPLEAAYTDYVNLFKSGLTPEKADVKLKQSKSAPSGIENYQYLQQTWKHDQISSFKNFLRLKNNKDIPNFEAMQKLFAFYH